MNYLIETIGCQMNVCDSDILNSVLLSYGGTKVNTLSDADVVIINTCAVRAQAEQKAFSFLGRVDEFKKEKKRGLKIVVVGCMAERLGDKIKRRFHGIDLIIGAKDIGNAAVRILDLCGMDKNVKSEIHGEKSDIVRYVTIMCGCDNYCSYCIVPSVRGKEISFDYKNIINECRVMAGNGAKEIILLGQNVNSYRCGDVNFASLIKKVSEIDEIQRIRFMTNHPKDLSSELIETMEAHSKVCPHIHLPMQSASNKVLYDMERKYTYEHYLGLVSMLRNKIPDINITTDIIVGFPGETEEDFLTTLKAIQQIRFGGLYVFRYSPRPNTKAAAMRDDVPLEEKKRRHAIILEESNKISVEIVSKYVGTAQEVLTEKHENGILQARTRSARKVFIKGGEKDLGRNMNVLIKEAKINSLFGDII
ncbi:MAG: tRNA (N6-isopentenyl adenosine(37)-C2)-methylthiotransferase MiaB [Endomicrobium sp.]|jgi:tRNA-2-methylthio-N6-dimethylallyladenosine synthase|nr:tRNA (N6-isopentenyl adenosine(37)-C2)-methylthiotransferase MiaB [Endomicrobium sp.]